MEIVTLTEAKTKLSSIISRLLFKGQAIAIRRRGKNVAVLMPYEEYVGKCAEGEPEGELLKAKGALGDVDGFEEFLEDIRAAREKALDRAIGE
jgi:prevent-host-death family protein